MWILRAGRTVVVLGFDVVIINSFTQIFTERKNDVEKRHKITRTKPRAMRVKNGTTHVTSTAPSDTTRQSVIKALPFFVHESEL